MPPKPHRVLLDRVSGYADEAAAYMRRRRISRKPFARLYYVGGRTAVGIVAADPAHRGERFVQQRLGLHHLCFRARERADVDALYELLKTLDATIVHPPEEGPWAPRYYSVLFEDPDGTRLEMNHVPGKGLFADTPKA